jgi:hypothetical protein
MPLRHIHLVSDSTGETLNSIARATLARFEEVLPVQHRWTLIRSRLALSPVLEGIASEPGPVLFTIASHSLSHALEEHCAKVGVPCLSVLDPVMELLQAEFGKQAREKVAAQQRMDDNYFRRIDAMHYVAAHDDGQGTRGIRDADVCLLGVSRSSKTPTCMYLANRGVRAANVPLVPGVPLPPELDENTCPIVGLHIEADALIEIRRNRLKVIGAERVRQDSSEYVDFEAVKAEVQNAQRLFAKQRWPVINVTGRSIEETAASVIQHIENWRKRHPQHAAPRTPTDPAAAVLRSA